MRKRKAFMKAFPDRKRNAIGSDRTDDIKKEKMRRNSL